MWKKQSKIIYTIFEFNFLFCSRAVLTGSSPYSGLQINQCLHCQIETLLLQVGRAVAPLSELAVKIAGIQIQLGKVATTSKVIHEGGGL